MSEMTSNNPNGGAADVIEEPVVQIHGLHKAYGDNVVLRGIDLDVHRGEVVVVLGPSGSGKSTMLRCVNLLETPTSGSIVVEGVDITKKGVDINKVRSTLGMVFQQFNLFPHLSAKRNVMIAQQKVLKRSKEEAERIAEKELAKVGLADRVDFMPSQLSGGQQQRVAIARTLAPEPSVLFMDEPLSNLDAKLRLEMRYELQRLHVETGSTFVYVTHDQMEAMTLATQICLINNGVLQQYQPPLTVYNHPQNLFVADFVGNPSINFVEAKGAQQPDGSITLDILGGVKAVFRPREGLDLAAWFAERDRKAAAHAAERLAKSQEKGYVEKGNKDEPFRYHIAKVEEEDDSLQEEPILTNEDLVLGIRPEFLNITSEAPLKGEIYGAMPTGMESTIKVYVNGFLLTGVVFGSSLFTIGEQHSISFTGHHIMLFDRQSGDCIALGSLETL